MEICPNKSYKSNPEQEKSDWELLIDRVGSEDDAWGEYILNGFDIPTFENINVPAYDIKKNKEYVFPLQDKKETLELIDTLTYTEDEKLALDHLIQFNAPFVSFKDSPENVIAFSDKIKTILPLKYLSLSDPIAFDDIYIQELIIHNPTIGKIETVEQYPDPVEVQVQSERDFDLINENNNIFFSTHSIDNNTIENDVQLNKEAINVMQNILNVEVFDRTTPEGKMASDAELQKHIENYALMPGAQDRVFAFSVLGAHNTLSKVQLLPGFKTVHLYEEFGHLLVHYLDTLSNLGVTNPLQVERLWQKPPVGVTDYLAATDHYINGYTEAYQQKYDQLTYKRQKLKEIESRVLNDPGSFTPEELLNANVMLANNGYVLSDAYILSDANGRNRIQNDAETLARIEIAGRIVGEALHAAKINDPIKIAAKNKSLAVYIGNIVKNILNMGIKLLNIFRSSAKAYKLLQTRTNNLPQDAYSRMAYEIAEGFWNDPARFASRVPRSNVESAEGPTNVFATNDFLESISIETKTKMDTLLNEVTGDIKKQIEDIQEEINKYQMGPLFAARNNALPALYFNHKDITAGNLKFSVPQEIMNFLYTQNPDTIKAWKQQADINQANWLAANPNATPYEIARKAHIHYLDQILSELQKQFDPLLGYDYAILYSDWLNVSIAQLDKLPEPQKTQAKESFYKQLEMFSNMPGHQNYWDSYEKEYQENMAKENTKNTLTIKLKDILRAVNRKNHERALRWYVLGEKLYDANGNVTEIPPLFSEIDNLNKRLELKESRILQKEEILNTLILQNAPPAQITLAQNELAAEYLSNEDYIYLRSKLNHFQKIYDTINAANTNNNIKNLFQFKKDREDFEAFLKTGKESLEGSRFILDKYKNRFVAHSLIAIAEKEKGGVALTLDEKLALLKAAETIPEQLSWFQSFFGLEVNNDFTWSKIITDIGRIAMQSQQAATDRFKNVEQLIINNANILKSNPIIKKQLKKTLSNSITELFHEFNEVGKRTHFFINKYFTEKFEKEVNANIEKIYEEINATLLSEGFTIQLPTGDNPAAKIARTNLLDFSGGANPYMKTELKRLKDLYNEKMLIHNLTYYEGKPKAERDAIIAQKKLELDPYNFNLWYNSVVKVYYKFVPSTTSAGYQDREEVEYYKGELAIPATRPNATQIVMADYTKKFKNKAVTLPAVNFVNNNFTELYSIPEWAQIYDELAVIQEEAYQNYLKKHPVYSYIGSKQSWAFKGDATDRIGRLSQLKVKALKSKLADDLHDISRVDDEDIVWKTSVNEKEIPLRGRIRYDEKVKSSPNVLADNYFVLLKKGWTSANTFVLKKNKQKEIEVLRNIMIERNVKHTDIVEENRSMVSKALAATSKYLRTFQFIDAATNTDWDRYINSQIDTMLYNEEIDLDPNKITKILFTTLLQLNALTTKYQIAGQWFPAFAAWSQAFYRTAINVNHGRYTNVKDSTNKGGLINKTKNFLNTLKYMHENIFDEKMAIRAEYIKGKPISKSSLMMQELGLNGDKVIDRFRLGIGGKLLDDFLGYGNMRLANTGWARTNMRMVLTAYKWVDGANSFMNPNQYFDWLKLQNPDITIKDTEDALGNTIKGAMTLHEEIPESNSFWNMYEVYKDSNGNNQLRIIPGNEHKITPYIRSMAGKYVLNIQNGIDMALTGNSKIMRNPLVRLLFSLKKFIIPLLVDNFLSYHDMNKGVYHKSYYSWLKNYGISIMNSLNFMDQQKQIQGTAFRKAMANDYAAREAFAHLIVAQGISLALNFFKVPIVNMANEECFGPDGNKNSIACRMKLWISINYKRAISEMTGLYDPTKWILNFDKPIAMYDTTMDWILMGLSGIFAAPVVLYNLIFDGNLDEGTKSKGPYKDLNPVQESLIKAVPAFRGIHSAYNVEALINRDQYLTKQLNAISLNYFLNMPMNLTTDRVWPTEFNTYFDFQKPYPQVRATKPKN